MQTGLLKRRLNILILQLLAVFCYLQCGISFSATLYQTSLNEDTIILLDVIVDKRLVVRSLDAYQYDGNLTVAIEPLFDALKLRYQLTSSDLTVWKDNEEYVFNLSSSNSGINQNELWASDGFYLFVSLDILKNIFNLQAELDLSALTLKIESLDKNYQFPFQKLAELDQQRRINKLVYANRNQEEYKKVPITISDKYRLFTVPHGRIRASFDANQTKQDLNGSIQLTSDLLYHSANLTLSQSNQSNLNGNLSFSRYKTSPDDYILGLFDYYRFGDISNNTNLLSTTNSSGLGFNFNHQNSSYRANNSVITIREVAPPEWEAELFRNKEFLVKTTVPADGQLIFADVEVNYGANDFEIKLYGPYGETRTINKRVTMNQNALSAGDIAYSFFGLDNQHRLINDNSNVGYELNEYGGSVDFGITDNWQIGFSYNGTQDNDQYFNLKNAFTFPNLLLENSISLDQDQNYAQTTSLKGGVFNSHYYSIYFESAKNFESNRISAGSNTYSRLSASYSIPSDLFNNTFNILYQSDDRQHNSSLSHSISTSFGNIRLRNNLTYNSIEFNQDDSNLTPFRNESLIGSFGLSGSLFKDLRISANINYDVKADDPILKSSSINVIQRFKDSWNNSHYLSARYIPLSVGDSSSWRLDYRTALQNNEYVLTFNSYYDQDDTWGIGVGVQFFLGYDYRNNKFIFDDQMSTSVASLDIHTYLDRQLNGIPDPLDYNLENVTFNGIKEWETLQSGVDGHTVLPGVPVNSVFPFSAKWQQGSATINNDYTVFTHAGAYVDVNMPFYLSTDLIGFVLRQNNASEVGLLNAEIQLLDENKNIIRIEESDMDGYFEFVDLPPGSYQIRISADYLVDKGYTSDNVGFNISTAGQGGLVELPTLVLTRKNNELELKEENIRTFIINEDSTESMVWDEDEKKRRNYFTLPAKKAISALHSLTQDNQLKLKPLKNSSLVTPENTSQRVNSPTNMANANVANMNEVRVTNNRLSILPTISINKVESSSTATNTTLSAEEISSFIDNYMNEEPLEDTELPSTRETTQYTLQLGSYASQQDAIQQALQFSYLPGNTEIEYSPPYYKITYGSFDSLVAGNNFASENLKQNTDYFTKQKTMAAINSTPAAIQNPQTTSTDNSWVIQLSAQKNVDNNALILAQFARLENIFTARKKNANGEEFQCVISKSFTSKNAAEEYLRNTQLNGWILPKSQFYNINQLK